MLLKKPALEPIILIRGRIHLLAVDVRAGEFENQMFGVNDGGSVGVLGDGEGNGRLIGSRVVGDAFGKGRKDSFVFRVKGDAVIVAAGLTAGSLGDGPVGDFHDRCGIHFGIELEGHGEVLAGVGV